MAGENVRRVYEIDVKLAAEAAATLRGIQNSMREVENVASSAGKRVKSAFGGQILFNVAVFGAIKQGFDAIGEAASAFVNKWKGIAEVQASLERLRLGFTTINARGLAGASEEIEYVRKVTREMGIEFQSAAQSFLKLSASARNTNLEGRKTREVFEAISLASRNLGLSTLQTENAFRALEQMISKGVVQQEELRGQLSEAIPGAVQIAARAMGVTTSELQKLIKAGQVFSDDFIPKFAAQLKKEFGVALPEGLNKAILAINNFNSAFESLKQSVTDAGAGEFAANRLNSLTGTFDNISAAIRRAKEEGEGFWTAMARGFVSIGQGQARAFEQQLKDLDTQIATLKKNISTKGSGGGLFGDLIDSNFKNSLADAELRRAALIAAKKLYDDQLRVQRDIEQSDNRLLKRSTEMRAENTRLERSLEGLRDRYVDKLETRAHELKQLHELSKAGKIEAAEFDRLYKAIIEKTKATDEDTRARERAERQAASFLVRLDEEHVKLQTLLADQRATKRFAAETAEAQKISIRLSGQAKAAFDAEADSRIRRNDALAAQLKLEREIAKLDKELLDAQLKRIEKMEDEAEIDRTALLIHGNEKEMTLQLAIAKYELALAETELTLKEAINNEEGEATIARYKREAVALQGLIEAKRGLLIKEQEAKMFRDIDKYQEKDRQEIERQTQEINDALIDNFRRTGSLGKAFVETFKQELRQQVFKVVVQPLLDPFVEAMRRAINIVADYLYTEIGKALQTAMAGNGFSGGGGFANFIGGLWGGGAGAGASIGGASFSGAAAGFDYSSVPFVFAKGGVMTPHGELPLRAYQQGGIADRPQMAIYGEGSMNEAFVPLPDGRRIPVHLQNSATNNFNVEVVNALGVSAHVRKERGADGSYRVVLEPMRHQTKTQVFQKLTREASFTSRR
jgi:tape measure domain-containing protein